MPTSAFIDLLDDVQEQFVTETVALLTDIYSQTLGPDGNAYGDVQLSRGERIERVVDLAQRGVMDAFRMVCEAYDAPWYERLHGQFVKDIEASPLEQGV